MLEHLTISAVSFLAEKYKLTILITGVTQPPNQAPNRDYIVLAVNLYNLFAEPNAQPILSGVA